MSSETLPPSVGVTSQVARFPYSLRFPVDDAQRLLREQRNVLQVQELFSVVCFIQSSQQTGPGELVTIAGNSQELLEKAKCYVMAMCQPEVHSDLARGGRTGHRLAGLLWGPSSKFHAILEKNSLVYMQHLTAHDGSSIVRVQGSKQQVIETMSRLNCIADTIESEHHSPPPHIPTPTTAADNSDFLKALAVLSQEDKQALRVAGHDNQLPIPPRTLVEPDMQRQIDYYVKQLGYPQDKVETTLESLGRKASVNDVINRLNKVSPRRPSMSMPSGGVLKAPVPAGPSTGEYLQTIGIEEVAGLVGGVVGERVPRKVVDRTQLRPIVIDGSNVAMRHGNGQVFSCRGIQLVVEYFRNRGHDHIKVFVPEWRKETSRPETPITDQHILDSLEKEGVLLYTPSRKISGRRIVCYDDRYIIRYAQLEGGVIVSNDQFRDLMQEDNEWRRVIEQRLLQFVFANDHFMPPDDPLGKSGPTLDNFLRKDPREQLGVTKKSISDSRGNSMPVCPHLGNCTFGRKCRYYHPDREPQKVEHAGGSGGSSGGSYTPSTSSRSATPSPSPDNRSQGMHSSSKSSREDLYGSRYSSSDDLYRGEREKVLSGEISSARDVNDLADKFSQTSIGQTSPTKHLYNGGDSYHPQTGPHLSIMFPHPPAGQVKTAPLPDASYAILPPLSEGSGRPQNRTFPLAHPQAVRSTRPGNMTEEHTYQPHPHSVVPYDDPLTFVPHDGGVGGSQATLLPRDACKNQQYQYTPGPPQGYPQPNDYRGGVVDHTHMKRDPRYRARMGVVNQQPMYAQHQAMNSYDPPPPPSHRGGDQSIPLHNLHQQHFSPNHQLIPHHQGYVNNATPHPHHVVQPAYHHHQEPGYHRSDAPPTVQQQQQHPSNPRHELFRMANAVLPKCDERIRRVMRCHPELTTPADYSRLVDLVHQMD